MSLRFRSPARSLLRLRSRARSLLPLRIPAPRIPADLARSAVVARRAGAAVAQAGRFIWLEALSCLFPTCVFLGLGVAKVVPLPIPRYDALLVYCLVLTFGFWAVRLET